MLTNDVLARLSELNRSKATPSFLRADLPRFTTVSCRHLLRRTRGNPRRTSCLRATKREIAGVSTG